MSVCVCHSNSKGPNRLAVHADTMYPQQRGDSWETKAETKAAVCRWQSVTHICLFGAPNKACICWCIAPNKRMCATHCHLHTDTHRHTHTQAGTFVERLPCHFVQQGRHLCACSVPASRPGPAARRQLPAHFPLLLPHSPAPAFAGWPLQQQQRIIIIILITRHSS